MPGWRDRPSVALWTVPLARSARPAALLVVLVGGVVASACASGTGAAPAPTLLTAAPAPISPAPSTAASITEPPTTTTEPPTTSTTEPSTTSTTVPIDGAPASTDGPATSGPTATMAPVSVPTAPAQAPTGRANQPAAWPAFDDVVSSFMDRRSLAGASVAVSYRGRLVYAQTYGTRDTATGEPVDYSSRFNLASLSKVFTTATVMHLVEQGRLDLDARVVDVLAGRLQLPSGYDRRFDAVTVRQLLSHTSGLNPKPPLGPIGTDSCDGLVAYALSKPLIHQPGNYRYANANFCLLGDVLETLGEGSWFDVVQRVTLEPLGITDVALGHPGQTAPGDVVHRADPVATGQNPLFLDALGPAGQLIGTPDDVVRVLDALYPGNSATPLVQPETFFSMVLPQAVTYSPTEHYGYGLFVWDGGVTIGHTGSLPMVRAMVAHQSDDYTWCILVNGTFDDYSSGFRTMMRRAIDATGGVWPDVDYTQLVP